MHKLLGGLCAALLFLAGLPQIGHAADPVPLKTAWLGEHEAFAAWYAKQKGWDLEEGFRLEMLSYDSGKQLMAGMNTAHWEIDACGAIPALTASLDNQAEIIAIGNDESLATGIYARKDSPILGHTGYNALYPEMAGTGGTVRGKTILCTAGSSAHYTVHKWLEAAKLTGNRDMYFVMTCGGDIGNAGSYLKPLCAGKGMNYRGCTGIKMPENYIALFKTPREEEAAQIIGQAEGVIDRAAEMIGRGERLPEPEL